MDERYCMKGTNFGFFVLGKSALCTHGHNAHGRSAMNGNSLKKMVILFLLFLLYGCNGGKQAINLTLTGTAVPVPKKTVTLKPDVIETLTLSPNENNLLPPFPTPCNPTFVSLDLTNNDSRIMLNKLPDAYWTENGSSIDYSLQISGQDTLPKWYQYHLETEKTDLIPPLFIDDKNIWDRFGIPAPYRQGLKPQEWHYISPSGQWIIYPIYIPEPEKIDSEYQKGKTQIWISSFDGSNKRKIFDFDTIGILFANWTKDESEVAFTFSTMGGSDLLIAKVKNGNAVHLNNLAGSGFIEGKWWLSPDGEKIAFSVGYTQLAVYFLNAKNTQLIDGVGNTEYGFDTDLSWANDSEKIFYFWDGETRSIRVYDLRNKSTNTILDESILKKVFQEKGENFNIRNFKISPDEKKVLFVGSNKLWIVKLCTND